MEFILELNGNVIEFNNDKRSEWPGEKFLKFHNECFEDNRNDLGEYDSDDMAESVKKAQHWLSNSS